MGGAGFDTLHFSLVGEWDREAWPVRVRELELAALAAEGAANGEAGPEAGRDYVEHPEGGRVFVRTVHARYGIMRMEWLLEYAGVRILVARQAVGVEGRPNVAVQIGSQILMQLGHEAVWADVLRLLSLWGFKVNAVTIARVDLCADLVGQRMQGIAEQFVGDRYVCRARKDSFFRENKDPTGITFGCRGSGVFCRVYDKLVEGSKKDPEKLETLIKDRLGGIVPDALVRTEFELTGEWLRENFDVRTPQQLFARVQDLARYLTTDWLRFTEHKVDRDNRNQGRAGLATWWERVQSIFSKAFGIGCGEKTPQPKDVPEKLGLAKQAAGALKSMIASARREFGTYAEAVQWAVGEVVVQLAGDGCVAEVESRREKFAARLPLIDPVADEAALAYQRVRGWMGFSMQGS